MKWQSTLIIYEKESRISIQFEKNIEWNNRMKTIPSSKWSMKLRCWHIPDTDENRIKYKIETIEQQFIRLQNQKNIKKFELWLNSKRYSVNTIKTYKESLQIFSGYYKDKLLEKIDNEDIIHFNNDYILLKKLSSSYQNQIVNAIKLYYKVIQGSKINIDLIHRPRLEKTLPNVLSKYEVKSILESPKNLKHRCLLALTYSCGMRRSEVLNLKPIDIDSKRNIIIIRG